MCDDRMRMKAKLRGGGGFCAAVFAALLSGCARNNRPPEHVNDYYKDTMRMARYIRSQGIDKIKLSWSADGTWAVDLSGSNVSNLDWIAGTRIDVLALNDTAVTDLSPLTNVVDILCELYVNNTGVSDLSPLIGATNLDWLEIQDTKVSDLSPLKNIGIRFLHLDGSPCSDLSDVSTNRLQRITFSLDPEKRWTGIDHIRMNTNIQVNQWMSPEVSWEEYDSVYNAAGTEEQAQMRRRALGQSGRPPRTPYMMRNIPDIACLAYVRPPVFTFFIYHIAIALFIPMLAMSIRACASGRGGKAPRAIWLNLFPGTALLLAGIFGMSNPLTRVTFFQEKIRVVLCFGFSLAYFLMFAVFCTVRRFRDKKR